MMVPMKGCDEGSNDRRVVLGVVHNHVDDPVDEVSEYVLTAAEGLRSNARQTHDDHAQETQGESRQGTPGDGFTQDPHGENEGEQAGGLIQGSRHLNQQLST
jgi:hypothetical protein